MVKTFTDAEILFYHALRHSLWKDIPNYTSQSELIAQDYDLNKATQDLGLIIRWAQKQTVQGLVFEGLQELHALDGLSFDKLSSLVSTRVKNIQSHKLLNSIICELGQVLKRGGIQGVILKGQGNAYTYPDPLLRQCGDIDLYVGEEKLNAAAKLLEDYGIPCSNNGDKVEKHLNFTYKEAEIELHKKAAVLIRSHDNKDFQAWTKEELPAACESFGLLNSEALKPSPDYNAVYIFYHLYHHFIFSGVGLRQLCDLARHLYFYRDKINLDRLRAKLEQYKLLKVWQHFIYILVQILGLPIEYAPFYDPSVKTRALKMYENIEKGGNFGKYSSYHDQRQRPKGYISGKLYSFRNCISMFYHGFAVSAQKSDILLAFVKYFHTGISVILDHYWSKVFRRKAIAQ